MRHFYGLATCMWLRAGSETRHGDAFQSRDDPRDEPLDSTRGDNFICRHRRTLTTSKRTPSNRISSLGLACDSPKPMPGTPLQIPRESQAKGNNGWLFILDASLW